MIARVFAACGRYHLEVAGVVVATQGDICRDECRTERCWTHYMLEAVADRINGAVNAEVVDVVRVQYAASLRGGE
jgi:hypothetical protein